MEFKGVDKSSVFQDEGSRFYERAQKIEDFLLLDIEPQLDVMLDWAL